MRRTKAFSPSRAKIRSRDPQSAGPPDGLHGGNTVGRSPAGLGFVAEGGERIAAQDDLQGAVDHALSAGEVQCPVLVLALPVIFGIEQQVEKRRGEVGLVGLDEHLAASGVEQVVLASVDERPFQQRQHGRIEGDGRQPLRRPNQRRRQPQA